MGNIRMLTFCGMLLAMIAHHAFARDSGLPTTRAIAGEAPYEGWPPSLDRSNTTVRSLDGRTIERYAHGCRDQWGCPAPQQNSFYVVSPKARRNNAPLYVVLHPSGPTAFETLAAQFLHRYSAWCFKNDPADIITHVPDDFYGLFLNSTPEEWWGWGAARGNSARYAHVLTPVEKRVLDSIEWLAAQYRIDRNRIYLCGASMGGCGTMGIGMPHGDIFAAISVWVPAGTEYVAYRMGFPPPPAADASKAELDVWTKQISGVGLPDPPPLVALSATNDTWSQSQDVLLRAAHVGRLALIVGWGPFGHTQFRPVIAKYPQCNITLEFPWLDIRRNEAYPVFTNATSDQRVPWLNTPGDFDESGQINAYFRWKNQDDAPTGFTIKLWIAHPTVGNPPTNMPASSMADITLRRFQHFRIKADETYTWRLARNRKLVASGKVRPDAASLLTIREVMITTVAAELSVKPD